MFLARKEDIYHVVYVIQIEHDVASGNALTDDITMMLQIVN